MPCRLLALDPGACRYTDQLPAVVLNGVLLATNTSRGWPVEYGASCTAPSVLLPAVQGIPNRVPATSASAIVGKALQHDLQYMPMTGQDA
jgi:hypothetical protein